MAKASLATHDDLLEVLRSVDGIREKSPGHFYRKSRACLHFHGSGPDLHADVRFDKEWEAVPAATPAERMGLVEHVRQQLADA